MRKTMRRVLVVLAMFTLSGCPKEPRESVRGTAKSVHTLDLILGGPFVFMRQSNCINMTDDCIAVWIPDVASHGKPILFGFESQLYELERMPADYTLTGMIAAANFNPLTPVTGASSWVIPGKTLKIPPTPQKTPYLILKLPIPKEIVPWNADPLEPTITSPVMYAPGKQPFATMTIFRYDYDDSKLLELTSPPVSGSKGLELDLEVPSVGKERVLMMQVIPQKPDPAGDEHQHSREAYQELMNILGLKGNIAFPPLPAGYKRNIPIHPGVLPDDLLYFINSGVTVSKGRINDCKAMAVFVDPTK
jgi:hypothetical protein